MKLGDSGAPEEDERDHQTDVLEEVGSMHQQSFEKGDKNYVQSKEEIEMKERVKPKRVWIRVSFTLRQCKNNVCNSARQFVAILLGSEIALLARGHHCSVSQHYNHNQ